MYIIALHGIIINIGVDYSWKIVSYLDLKKIDFD